MLVDQSLSPPTLDVVIRIAEKFSDTNYKNLADLISKPEATSPDEATIKQFCDENDISQNDLRYFLPLLRYLFLKTQNLSDQDIFPSLKKFVEENGGENVDAERVANRISELLVHRDNQEAALKRERLSQGFLPYLLDAASFVDLRHDFSRDDDGKLNGELGHATTVIQLKLETNSPRAYERFSIIQLDEKALNKLQETLTEIQQKLEILRKSKDG